MLRCVQEWLKSLRASSSPPSPFCLLLLFALSRQHKLEAPVLGLVKVRDKGEFRARGCCFVQRVQVSMVN